MGLNLDGLPTFRDASLRDAPQGERKVGGTHGFQRYARGSRLPGKEVRAWLDANATRKSDDKQSFRARNDDPNLLTKAKEWQAKKPLPGMPASPGRRNMAVAAARPSSR